MRSGLSMFFAVEFQVWNSMTFICAALTSASARRHLEQRGVAGPQRRVELAQAGDAAACRRASGRTARRSMPVGPRTSDTGRPFRCGSIHSATLS